MNTQLNPMGTRVLRACVRLAAATGDRGVEFCFSELSIAELTERQLKGYISALTKKGYIRAYDKKLGKGYFDAEVTIAESHVDGNYIYPSVLNKVFVAVCSSYGYMDNNQTSYKPALIDMGTTRVEYRVFGTSYAQSISDLHKILKDDEDWRCTNDRSVTYTIYALDGTFKDEEANMTEVYKITGEMAMEYLSK